MESSDCDKHKVDKQKSLLLVLSIGERSPVPWTFVQQ